MTGLSLAGSGLSLEQGETGSTAFPITSGQSGVVSSGGTLIIKSGGTEIISGVETIASGGSLNIAAGGSETVSSGATFTVASGGTLSIASGGAEVVSSGGSVTNSGLLAIAELSETYTAPTISSNVLTINLLNGTVFNVANTANITTFTISNATASRANSFTLILTANGSGFTQAWGASVKWPAGSAPTLTTTNGKVDILTFVTNDGGTTWYGFVGGQNY